MSSSNGDSGIVRTRLVGGDGLRTRLPPDGTPVHLVGLEANTRYGKPVEGVGPARADEDHIADRHRADTRAPGLAILVGAHAVTDGVGSIGRNTWGVGLELSLPIGLRSGRGERDRARAEVARQEARIAQLALSLEEELRDALRRYENGNLRLELAREAAGAAAEQVRIGLIEFENGRSTAFELVRLAADLASAQQELSRALVRTATARADLYRLVGPSDEDRFVAFGRNR